VFVVVCRLGYSGHVQISNNADRLGEYSLWQKPRPGSAIYKPLVNFQMTSYHNKLGLGVSEPLCPTTL